MPDASIPFPTAHSPHSGESAMQIGSPQVSPPSRETRANVPRPQSPVVCWSPRLYVQTSVSPTAWIIGQEL